MAVVLVAATPAAAAAAAAAVVVVAVVVVAVFTVNRADDGDARAGVAGNVSKLATLLH